MNDNTSDEDEPEPKPKRQRKLRLLGNISLLTSDEDEKPTISRKKKTLKSKKSTKSSSAKIVSLLTLTSDEEDNKIPVKKTTVKREHQVTIALDISDDNDSDHGPPLSKKTKVAVSTAKSKVSIKNVKKKASTARNKTSTKEKNVDRSAEIQTKWTESELLAQKCAIEEEVAQNLISLINEGNTIPFIARYRKNITKNMSPDEIREVKETFDDISKLKEKICTVAKVIKQAGKLDEKLRGKISNVRTVEELDHIFAPFKPENKGTLASRAKKLGLEDAALKILNNTGHVTLETFVNESKVGLKSIEEVQNGLVHIISSEIAVDTELLNCVRDLRQRTNFYLKTVEKKANASVANATNAQNDKEKYEVYFNKSFRIDNLQSYQVLAINRGESQKALTVKIDIPEFFNRGYKRFCSQKWLIYYTSMPDFRTRILNLAIEDSLTRHIQPLIIRQIRNELTVKAHRQSTDIFATNLKHLLMAPPWKGKHILGMDPGFKNGVKLAIISPTGKFLESNVIYPHMHNKNVNNEAILRDMIPKYNCDTIGIGNGHACRQTEEWVSGLIKNKFFGNLDVKYTIVNEDGASIYSCSAEAKKEFGDLDPNIISAISIARRLQDPLAELVKVEPNHLGVGMYQLDIKKKELENALNDVVSECVSFVGVDLNTASQCLLKRVAGLSDKKADLIINYRESHGPFTHRAQLRKVYSIGEKCFQQCAGFLRISPLDPKDKSFYNKENTTKLDSTIIHPESYAIAKKIVSEAGLKESDIGNEEFIEEFNSKKQKFDVSKLVEKLKTSKETIYLIFDALSRKCDYDMRMEGGDSPLFKEEITEMSCLKPGMVLTGKVTNVVQFGVFVDCGVGQNGLIHVSKLNNLTLHIGDKVETKVLTLDLSKKRLALEAVCKF